MLRAIWGHMKPHWRLVVAQLGAMALTGLLEGLIPLSTKYIVDDAVLPKRMDRLVYIVLGLILVAILTTLGSALQDYLSARIGSDFLRDLQERLFAKLQELGLDFFANNATGDILTCFSTDLQSFESAVVMSLPNLAISLMGLATTVAIMVGLDWRLSIAVIVGVLVSALSARIFEKPVARASYKCRQELANVLSCVHESIAAQPLIRTYFLCSGAKSSFRVRLDRLYRIGVISKLLSYALERVPYVGVALVHLAVLCTGAWLALHDAITIGTLVAFLSTLASASTAVAGLTWLPYAVDASGGLKRTRRKRKRVRLTYRPNRHVPRACAPMT